MGPEYIPGLEYVAAGVATAGLVQSGLLGPLGPIVTSVIDNWRPPNLMGFKFKVSFQHPEIGVQFLKP
jgi:hypothetical protein